MADCPKCGSEIGTSSYCGCGWGRRPQRGTTTIDVEPRCRCAFMGCEKRAMVRIKVTTTDWSNFCAHHFDAWTLSRAQETCERVGLKTTEQKRLHVMEKMKAGPFKPLAYEPYEPEREPGQDDDERAA